MLVPTLGCKPPPGRTAGRSDGQWMVGHVVSGQSRTNVFSASQGPLLAMLLLYTCKTASFSLYSTLNMSNVVQSMYTGPVGGLFVCVWEMMIRSYAHPGDGIVLLSSNGRCHTMYHVHSLRIHPEPWTTDGLPYTPSFSPYFWFGFWRGV